MIFSLRDKLALIYTRAGTQSAVAREIGISHQKVGRILTDSYAPGSRVLKDRELIAAIETAFKAHKQATQRQAREHGLPYLADIPVFYRRMPLKGVPGDRVAVLHAHWLSNDQRDLWIERIHETDRFAALSVQSMVNLVVYNKRADDRQGKKRRAKDQRRDKTGIQIKILTADMNETERKAWVKYMQDRSESTETKFADLIDSIFQKSGARIEQQSVIGPMFTKYTWLDAGFEVEDILDDVNNNLETRHDPSIGEPGTARATALLLQVDSRNDKDKAYRSKHPRAAIARSAGRHKAKAKPRRPKK